MAATMGVLMALTLAGTEPETLNYKAPELSGATAWLNGKETKLADLKGKVVVVNFWTFGCINCRRNIPHFNAWHKDLADKGVVLVGVHTPEFDHEARMDNVKERLKKLEVTHLTAVDNDRKIWKAFENRYWPSTYVIDKLGVVRFRWDGELNFRGENGEKTMREKILALARE